jgi:hypothetical protein
MNLDVHAHIELLAELRESSDKVTYHAIQFLLDEYARLLPEWWAHFINQRY